MAKEFLKSLRRFYALLSNGGWKIFLLCALSFTVLAVCIGLSFFSFNPGPIKAGDVSKVTIVSRYTFSFHNKYAMADLARTIESGLPVFYDFREDHTALFRARVDRLVPVFQAESDRAFLEKLREERIQFTPSVTDYALANRQFLSRYTNRLDYIYNMITSRYLILDRLTSSSNIQTFDLLTRQGSRKGDYQRSLLYPLERETVIRLIGELLPRTDALFRAFLAETLINLTEPTALLNTAYRTRLVEQEIEKLKKNKIIEKGTVIVNRGDLLNTENISRIEAYRDYEKENFRSLFGIYLVLAFILFGSLLYRFYAYEKPVFRLRRNVIVSLLFFIMINLFYYIANVWTELHFVPAFLYVPFAIAGICLPLLLNNSRVAVILLVSFSLFSFFYTGFDLIAYCNMLAITFATIYTSRILYSRKSFFQAALFLALVELIFAWLHVLYNRQSLGFGEWGILILFAAGNALISSIISSGILPALEYLFNIPTRFRLLEIANPATSPLLQKLKEEAPGTYNHSLMLGDLCEAAAGGIGVDPLLAKVGAYYHDIGKTEIPHYFIENQDGHNKHNDIKPQMSVSVIKSHVKIGVELGHRFHLPEEVIDFIREHHGTTAIAYFYHQAMGLYGDENVNIQDYEYPGPRPQSKATALLLLADSIEASVRAYYQNNDTFNTNIIEDIIEDMVQKRLTQGQFDDCDITIHDLRVIADTFHRFLSGYYHKRIEYGRKQ